MIPLFLLFFLVTAFALAPSSSAQQTRWLNAGSLQNWYSEIGNEREHGLVTSQQYGLRWPAILEYQDAQAGKAFWIGLQVLMMVRMNHLITRSFTSVPEFRVRTIFSRGSLPSIHGTKFPK